MDPSEQMYQLVREEVHDLLSAASELLHGDDDAFTRLLHRGVFSSRLARDFVFVGEGRHLDHRGAIEWLRGLKGLDPVAELRLLDLELRHASEGVCVAQCTVEYGDGAGYVATLVIARIYDGLRILHAHATRFDDVVAVVPRRLGRHRIDPDIVALVPRELCRRKACLALSRAGAQLRVAFAEPDEAAIDDIAYLTGFRVQAVLEDRDEILQALDEHHRGSDGPPRPDDVGG